MNEIPVPFRLCMEKYYRRVPWLSTVVDFPCHHPQGHVDDHSWAALQDADRAAISGVAQERADVNLDEPIMVIGPILSSIHAGKFDPYLEAILSVAHSRKRMLRGSRSFEELVARHTDQTAGY